MLQQEQTSNRARPPFRGGMRHMILDTLSGADFEPGVAQNWAQFFVSEKSAEVNVLKGKSEPPRTRTWNPLIKSQLLYQLS